MFLSPTAGLDEPDPDPALLAFVKCHITSPAKWEVLRVLASHDGAWVAHDQLARSTHRQRSELSQALTDLTADGVVESDTDQLNYRLPADEPTSVVLRRLIHHATHSQELRAIIAAHLQHLRNQGHPLRTSPAVA